MTGLIFQKELILTNEMYQKSVTFVTIGTFWVKNLNMRISVLGCHDLVQKAMNFTNVAIISVKGSHYRINFWYISKNDAINIMKNSSLHEKKARFNFLTYIKNE